MVIRFCSVNIDRLKDGNVDLCSFFVIINKFLPSFLKITKEINVKKNVKKISS